MLNVVATITTAITVMIVEYMFQAIVAKSLEMFERSIEIVYSNRTLMETFVLNANVNEFKIKSLDALHTKLELMKINGVRMRSKFQLFRFWVFLFK